jgi:acyl carrier protein
MSAVSAGDIRDYILGRYSEALAAGGWSAERVGDDFDLLTEGVIDSFGILELVSGMEEHFGIEIDYEAIDPQDLTVIGPLSKFIEGQTREQDG